MSSVPHYFDNSLTMSFVQSVLCIQSCYISAGAIVINNMAFNSFCYRWFYQQIHLLYNTEATNSSVFEWNPTTGKVRLKESVSIHMYISTAPCGDASAFAIE